MNEIRQIADTVTVMRDGRIIETVPVEGADTRTIVRLMLGSEIAEHAAITPGRRPDPARTPRRGAGAEARRREPQPARGRGA